MQPHESPQPQPPVVTPSPGTPGEGRGEGHLIKRPAPKGKPRTGLTLGICAVALAIALAIGFFIVQHQKATEADALNNQTTSDTAAAPSVDVVKVNYAASTYTVGYPGETRGWYQSTIYARVNGYVAKWLVDIGDHVKKDQVLATIETPDLDAQLEAAEHQLTVSQSQVAVMQANTEFAKSTNDRFRDAQKGAVSDLERDEKKSAYDSSVAQLKAAEAKVSADQADVDRIQAIEGYKQVKAPFDGVITGRRVDIGDLVTAGSTASTSPLYTMAQINEVRLFVDVPQRATAGMDVGVPAVAVANEFPNKKFQGKITRTSTAIDPTSRTLRVEVDIDNPDMQLVPGMYVEVSFALVHKGLLQVPASALMFKSGGPQVAVVDDDSKVTFHDVNIAIDNGDFVEVSSGVSAGNKIALNLSNQIAEGDKVTANIVETEKKVAASTDPNSKGMAATVAPAQP